MSGRKSSSYKIWSILRENGPMTNKQIQIETGFTPKCVDGALSRMIDSGHIERRDGVVPDSARSIYKIDRMIASIFSAVGSNPPAKMGRPPLKCQKEIVENLMSNLAAMTATATSGMMSNPSHEEVAEAIAAIDSASAAGFALKSDWYDRTMRDLRDEYR